MDINNQTHQEATSDQPTTLPPSDHATTDASQSPTPFASTQMRKLILIILIACLVCVFGVMAYYLGTKKSPATSSYSDNQMGQPANNLVNEMETSKTASESALFSGHLKKLGQDLGIYKYSQDDLLNNPRPEFVYYEAGTFNSGELAGYTRIVAVRSNIGPDLPMVIVLATKDFASYFLDDPDGETKKYPEDYVQNPYYFLNKDKIMATKVFATEHPQEIDLNQDIALFSSEYPTTTVYPKNYDDADSKIVSQLVTNFSAYKQLDSPFNNLTMYFQPFTADTSYLDQMEENEKEKLKLKQQYFVGESTVFVLDSTGLPVSYSLTKPENIKTYEKDSAEFETLWKKFEVQLQRFNDGEISEYPDTPEYVDSPSLGFDTSSLANTNDVKLFSSYKYAFPAICSYSLATEIVKLDDSELEQIGLLDEMPVYSLKNASHPLNVLAYKYKFDFYEQDATSWQYTNPDIEMPTLEEYTSRHPLLFIKDYWQRWAALGEYDIDIPGGCGKPVIYLYPTQPTEITVQFQAPVQFTVDIPTYHDYWQVLAHPDGSLFNLRPELTKCRDIDSWQKGMEYAKQACATNTYPYLYWAGNIMSQDYPVINEGWIVENSNLEKFLEDKLTQMGLNDQEKSDFTQYWLPDMQAKNAPYYRVSFLQTNELNSLFPMTVNPIPDTTFRLFLDYLPLYSKPNYSPPPQTLQHLVRNGFTLVEWGGLKQL